MRETLDERLKREKALADAVELADSSRAWRGEDGAVAGAVLDHPVRRMGYCQDVPEVLASDHPKVKRTDYCHPGVLLVEAYQKGLVVLEDLRGLALREVSVLPQAQQLSLLPNPLYGYLLQPLFSQALSSLGLSLPVPWPQQELALRLTRDAILEIYE